MSLVDQAQATANACGTPCWIVHPPHKPAYIALRLEDVEPCYQMLQLFLPDHSPSTWQPQ